MINTLQGRPRQIINLRASAFFLPRLLSFEGSVDHGHLLRIHARSFPPEINVLVTNRHTLALCDTWTAPRDLAVNILLAFGIVIDM